MQTRRLNDDIKDLSQDAVGLGRGLNPRQGVVAFQFERVCFCTFRSWTMSPCNGPNSNPKLRLLHRVAEAVAQDG